MKKSFLGADPGSAVAILTHQQLPAFPQKSAPSPDVGVLFWRVERGGLRFELIFITGVSRRENPNPNPKKWPVGEDSY